MCGSGLLASRFPFSASFRGSFVGLSVCGFGRSGRLLWGMEKTMICV